MFKFLVKLFGVFVLLILVGASCTSKIQSGVRPSSVFPAPPRFSDVGGIVDATPAINKNQTANDDGEIQAPNDNSPFRYEGGEYFGTVTVTGYAQIIKDVPDCGEFSCEEVYPNGEAPKVNLVDFVITTRANNLFNNEIITIKDFGQSFDGIGWVRLGCLIDNREGIKLYNDGYVGRENNLITKTDLALLVASGVKRQIQLQLTKPYYGKEGAHGASTCYSPYKNFKIVNYPVGAREGTPQGVALQFK